MNTERRCVRAACANRFKPLHKGHICCSSGCWTAILHAEIGKSAAGMRPLGFFGDREKIQSVAKKYDALSRSRAWNSR